ncbi:MAG: hypothetical protein AB7O94_02095 [Hyphomicrobiaceae bacterium]
MKNNFHCHTNAVPRAGFRNLSEFASSLTASIMVASSAGGLGFVLTAGLRMLGGSPQRD